MGKKPVLGLVGLWFGLTLTGCQNCGCGWGWWGSRKREEGPAVARINQRNEGGTTVSGWNGRPRTVPDQSVAGKGGDPSRLRSPYNFPADSHDVPVPVEGGMEAADRVTPPVTQKTSRGPEREAIEVPAPSTPEVMKPAPEAPGKINSSVTTESVPDLPPPPMPRQPGQPLSKSVKPADVHPVEHEMPVVAPTPTEVKATEVKQVVPAPTKPTATTEGTPAPQPAGPISPPSSELPAVPPVPPTTEEKPAPAPAPSSDASGPEMPAPPAPPVPNP